MHPVSAEQRGHEQSTISLRGIVVFVVIFVIALVVLTWLILVMYRKLVQNEQQHDRPSSAVVETRQRPEPQLQPFGEHGLPSQDVATMRDHEDVEFAKRGWIDARSGKVRVPDDIVARVTSAMERAPTSQGVSR